MPAFLAGPLAKWGSILLLIAAASVAGFVKGMAYEQMKQEAAISAAVQRQSAITNRIVDEHTQAKEKVRIVYQTIEKEVDAHAQEIDSSCTLPADFIGLYNRSLPSEAAGNPDATAGADGKDR